MVIKDDKRTSANGNRDDWEMGKACDNNQDDNILSVCCSIGWRLTADTPDTPKLYVQYGVCQLHSWAAER